MLYKNIIQKPLEKNVLSGLTLARLWKSLNLKGWTR